MGATFEGKNTTKRNGNFSGVKCIFSLRLQRYACTHVLCNTGIFCSVFGSTVKLLFILFISYSYYNVVAGHKDDMHKLTIY